MKYFFFMQGGTLPKTHFTSNHHNHSTLQLGHLYAYSLTSSTLKSISHYESEGEGGQDQEGDQLEDGHSLKSERCRHIRGVQFVVSRQFAPAVTLPLIISYNQFAARVPLRRPSLSTQPCACFPASCCTLSTPSALAVVLLVS